MGDTFRQVAAGPVESSLDVLSRAACLLEQTNGKGDIIRQSQGSKTEQIQHGSPPKELPTRVQKGQRMRDRQHTPPSMLAPSSGTHLGTSVITEIQSVRYEAGSHMPSVERRKNFKPSSPSSPPSYQEHFSRELADTRNSTSPENNNHDIDRKCAGTQTSFSSFPADVYQAHHPHVTTVTPSNQVRLLPGQSDNYQLLNLDNKTHYLSAPYSNTQPHSTTRPSSDLGSNIHIAHPIHSRVSSNSHPHYLTSSLGPLPPTHTSRLVNPHGYEINPLPLNLTVTSAGHIPANSPSVSHSQKLPQDHPSVFTSHNTYSATSLNTSANPQHQGRDLTQVVKHAVSLESAVKDNVTEPCDMHIEEHFRRSLGKNYPGAVPTQPVSSCNTTTTSTNTHSSPQQDSNQNVTDLPKAVFVSGTVDDHFAKSLGDAWTEMKVKKDKEALDSIGMRPGSVDDHFTKALGDTWLRIKASEDDSSAISCQDTNSRSPQPPPSLVPS